MSDDKTHYEERKHTVVTPENIQRVENLFTSEPNTSVKRGSQVLEISETLLQRILKEKLLMFAYKIQVSHQ